MRRTSGNVKRSWRRSAGIIGGIALVIVSLTRLFAFAVHADATGDWPTFLGSNTRTGYNANETIINPTTAPNLKLLWTASAADQITDEVIVANGMLYWGSWDGLLHASDPTTGQELWATNLGTKPGTCSHRLKGVVGSATVATVPIQGVATSVVFVAAGQDNLYALDAHTGTIIWQTNLGNDPAEFLYSSTTVYNGSVYIGVASTGDCPLVQGKVVRVNASTGQIQHTFKIVPDGCIGGAVRGSPTIDEKRGMLYVGTGNVGTCSKPQPLGSTKMATTMPSTGPTLMRGHCGKCTSPWEGQNQPRTRVSLPAPMMGPRCMWQEA